MTARVYCPRAVREGCPVPTRIARGIANLESLGSPTDEDIEDLALIACGGCAEDVSVEGAEVDMLPAGWLVADKQEDEDGRR